MEHTELLPVHPDAQPAPPTPIDPSSTAAGLRSPAEIAHEARNLLAALGLYCDLLDEPGVLAPAHRHLSSELRIVAATCRGLTDRLTSLGCCRASADSRCPQPCPSPAAPPRASTYWEQLPPTPIRDFAWELQTNRNLLAALAGPSVSVSMDCAGGALPVHMNSEDLTRILVNLVKNATEAMPDGGRIHLLLRERPACPEEPHRLVLNIEDTGLGIPPQALAKIFETGFTTRDHAPGPRFETGHRGLGLSITRSIVEAAGGQIHAANRDPLGACFQIELPVCV